MRRSAVPGIIGRMPTRLLPEARRKPMAWAVAVAVLLLAALAIVVHRSTTTFDTWMFRELYIHIGAGGASTLLRFSSPALSIGMLGLVVVFAALLRRWDVVALAAIAPAVAVVLTECVLKPMIGRPLTLDGISARGVFPSGHETAVTSTALVLLIVAGQRPLRARVRAVVIAALAVWAVVSAVGLVRTFSHYATDTIGAVCVSVAVVCLLALVIDRYGARLSSPGARSPASTTHAT